MPPGLTRAEFVPSISRHFLGPFEALADDHVRQVAIKKPLRGGGTLIADIWHCWTRANDPGPAMSILQSDEMAQDHFQDRLRQMMSKSEVLRSVLPRDRHAITNTEIKFEDGLPLYCSGPGINKLQTKAIRYISCDEVWLYKPGTVTEAEGRLGDFTKLGLSKLLLISQGSIEDDDFDRRFKDGSREEWHVQCLGCGEYFEPKFKHGSEVLRGLRWDPVKDQDGKWNIPECVKTIRYECPLCGHPHADGARTKNEWNRTGKYVPFNQNAPRSKRSFHWPGVIDWPWENLVEFYLLARNAYRMGIIEPTIQFWQKYMAEARSERTLVEDGVDLKRVTATMDRLPDEVMRVLACDVQKEGVFYCVCGSISDLGVITVRWWGRLFGGSAVKAQADKLGCNNVLIDSGWGESAKGATGVYALCCDHHSTEQGWFATRGAKEQYFWHQISKGKRVMRSYAPSSGGDPERGKRGEGRRSAVVIRFSSDVYNERLDSMMGNGQIVIASDQPKEDQDELRRHLGSEYRKQKRDDFTGAVKWVWVCPSGKNHYRDALRQIILAGIKARKIVDQQMDMA